ncbi:MAG TPA: hypothetical protein VMZ00_10915 [Sporichthya sp.]|nr:hypothetical protein [Sporichthya sp.]
MKSSPLAVIGALCLLAACGGSDQASPGPDPAASPTPSAAAALPELVGEWQRVQQCSELVTAFRSAGLGDAVLDSIAGDGWIPGVTDAKQIKDPRHPCDGAVSRAHSHFFTEDGQFGSRDANGQQVDDGHYRLVGDSTVVIDKVTFHYVITDHNTIAFTPVLPKCPPACDDAAWSVSVAYPGFTWQRTAGPGAGSA